MYSSYVSLIEKINNTSLINSSFKSNDNYQSILEHVSYEQGIEYIQLIKREFPLLSQDKIIQFISMNDLYGNPKKYSYSIQNSNIECSPTSLRYIYHALLILSYLKTRQSKKIAEIGCGYGGLFLAINFFSTFLNVDIEKYYLIDLPEVCELIKKYFDLHKENIHINYFFCNSTFFGSDIMEEELFLISNYCFTEIESEYRNNYISQLFQKINSGFIIWQTIFGLPITETKMINKQIVNYEEERPQTANEYQKNYFVYF
jgi:hypothetical protein